MTVPDKQQREQLQADLTRAVGTGRITLDQFDHLMGYVWTCESVADLDAIRRDYLGDPSAGRPHPPQPPQPQQGPPQPQPGPPPPPQGALGSPVHFGGQSVPVFKTTMGTIRRTGPWVVPPRQEFHCTGGSIHLDLRQAHAESQTVEFHIKATMGTIRILVPPGVLVTNYMSDSWSTVKQSPTYPHPNAPQVLLTGSMSGSSLTIDVVPLPR